MSKENPSAERYVAQYFVDRMEAAGYQASLGYAVPDLARAQRTGKIQCEIWLSEGSYQEWENNEYPIEVSDAIECYIFMHHGSISHVAGDWYDTCSTAVRDLARNENNRSKADKLWWDNQVITIDRASPLRRWDNGSDYSAGFLVARIDLPILFLTTIVP